VSRASLDAARAARLARLAWIAVGVYLIALGIAAVFRTQGDFNIYYRAGARVLQGETIYRLDESNHFLYAPIFAIFFAPFAALPMRAAQFGWYLVSAVSIVALIIGSSRMLFGRKHRLEAALIVVPIILSARFINNNIEHGQINLPTLALAVWAIILGEEDRGVISGAMLAAAMLIKPFAILAALFLLLERKWQPILFSIVFGIVLMLAPMAVFGIRGTIDQTAAYLQVVGSMTDRYTLMITNQSASSAIARLMSLGANPGATPSHLALYAGTGLELAIIAAVVIWFLRADESIARDSRPHRFQLAALFCIMPSMVPISWKSYYAALLIPYMLLTFVLWSGRPVNTPTPTATIALVAVSVVLNWISGNRANHFALFFSAHFLSSVILMLAIFAGSRWWQACGNGRLTQAGTVNNTA
jgi:Glycosyltransferase family 87